MWIVKLALRRPYTFVVLAVLIFIVGPPNLGRAARAVEPERED